jgi:DNA-binding NarL/FixJ family response regulator
MLDPDLHLAKTLVIEPNNMLRSVTAGQLRSGGVGEVVTCSRMQQARELLERDTFDIVICNLQAGEPGESSAQDLLNELRREQLLPFSTVFLMVTEQVTYAQALEAAETALDGFLVRPFTSAALIDRVLEARRRKRELAGVMSALEAGQLEVAVQRALLRFQERQSFWFYCGRVAAEVLLRLQRPQDALLLFERLNEARPSSWARVGMARSEWAAGRLGKAQKVIDALLLEDPACADALDLQGRLRLERSDFAGALESYRAASLATPGCLLRAQHAGALAFYLGHGTEAGEFLERARNMGAGTRLFDALSLYLLALVHHDSQDSAALERCVKELGAFAHKFPQSTRLARIASAARVLWSSHTGQLAQAAGLVQKLAEAVQEDGFDQETSQVVVSLWVRLPSTHTDAEAASRFARTMAMRFCSSRTITDFFVIVSLNRPPFIDAFKSGLAAINEAVEKAVQSAADGEPGPAIQGLLQVARQHRNNRFVEMASMLTKRYAPTLGPSTTDALTRQAADLSRRYSTGAAHIAGLQRANRSPGALVLKA